LKAHASFRVEHLFAVGEYQIFQETNNVSEESLIMRRFNNFVFDYLKIKHVH